MSIVNVLAVDDRAENLLALESALSGLGHNLQFASSADEALRYLLTNEVALILLDVQMPEVDGFELAELIRQRETTQHTPIIFISANSIEQQYVFKGYSLGAVDYITKPFEPEILRSKVRFFTTLFEKNDEIKRQAKLLEETNAALDALNEELEDRVRQRTLEIERTHRKLTDETAMLSRSQTRLALEYKITRELAVSDDVISAAPAILKAFCSYLGAEMGGLWLLDQDGNALECKHTELSKTSPAIELFIGSNLNQSFIKGVGLPGVVWEKKSPVWRTHSGVDERFPRTQLAAAAGFTSSAGMPIKVGDKIYGVIEFFSTRTLQEQADLVEMFESIGSELGQFIHRHRVELEKEKLLTQEMTLRQQAEKASRLKDEFLATVSHELRTPLNSILGWGQLLHRGALDDGQQKAALETIFRNAKAQSQLIDDLLDMSRLITGNFPLELAPTSVETIINDAIGIVRPQAAAKDVGIVPNFRAEDVKITCDGQRLQQMVWNLLVNAIKFTPEGGTIEVIVETAGDEVSIAVVDNGQGIDPEFLPHVFDRFRQADSTSTRRHRGLGLGLAIVTNLAELHGGRVAVASEGSGKGATFTIVLPYAATQSRLIAERTNTANRQPEKPFSSDPLKDIRVLIVEDDEDAAEMLSFALQAVGAETRTSHSASDAFAALSEWIPNALLSDISMPVEDGYSLIRRVRNVAEQEISAIPAIALTAMARSEDGDLALASGFQMHIPKPVDLEELTRSIAMLVRNHRS